ncbi:MAG: hypothetical protein ACP5N7_05505 [Candidatus Pacearchaeota archaeon]
MNNDFDRHVQKFNLDDANDRATYEDLLNRETSGEIKIERDQVTFDRTKGNQALIIVWWKEFR